MKIEFVFVTIVVLSLGLLSYSMLKPKIAAYTTFSEEKCNSLQGSSADNCWHSLAHQNMKKEFCNKIADNETKEHCFEHIPEK